MVQEYEYLDRMIELTRRKQDVVKVISEALKKQMICFQDHTFDEERYERIEGQKDEYISELNHCNDEQEELVIQAKSKIEAFAQSQDEKARLFRREIESLQELTLLCQNDEVQLKRIFNEYLSEERKRIQEKLNQRNTAATYYRNMNAQVEETSLFYDQRQ